MGQGRQALTEFLVTAAVVEKHVAGQHHVNAGDAPFLHVDVLVVIPVVTCNRQGVHCGECLLEAQ